MEDNGYRKWRDDFGPWIVLVVDELAELQALDVDVLVQAVNDPDTSNAILRSGRNGQQIRTALLGSLARVARFCGVTIVGATQYPSAEVLDQQIRTQLTIRVMLRVASGEQVNVVLGQGHANKDLGELHRTSRTGRPLDRRHPRRPQARPGPSALGVRRGRRPTGRHHRTPGAAARPRVHHHRPGASRGGLLAMTDRLPSHRAQVAQPRSDVIPEGDGAPSTHTHHTATRHRKVTTGHDSSGPLPFDAPSPIGAIPAVISMSAIVLLATITAVLRLYAGHPYRFHILAGLLGAIGIECLLLAAIAAVRARRVGPLPRDLDQADEDAGHTAGCVARPGRNVGHRPNPTTTNSEPTTNRHADHRTADGRRCLRSGSPPRTGQQR